MDTPTEVSMDVVGLVIARAWFPLGFRLGEIKDQGQAIKVANGIMERLPNLFPGQFGSKRDLLRVDPRDRESIVAHGSLLSFIRQVSNEKSLMSPEEIAADLDFEAWLTKILAESPSSHLKLVA